MGRKTVNLIKNVSKDQNITAIISAVVAAVPAEYIYHHTELFPSGEFNEMLIMVANKQVRILNELIPVLNIVFSRWRKFSYRLFHVHEVKESLQNGSLFFDWACKPQNCLFSRSGSFLADKNIVANNAVVHKVKTAYRYDLSKANQFLAGAKFYCKRHNLAHCAFMLHQVFDLSYRAIELLVMGQAKKTHLIQAHQCYIKPYVRQLAELFNQNDEEDIYLLYLLDEAYLAVRYENSYQITEAEIIRLFEKVDFLQHLANQVYQSLVNRYFDEEIVEGM